MVEGLTFFSSPTKGSCQEGSGFHRVNATEGRENGRTEVQTHLFSSGTNRRADHVVTT